ncbi:MAG: RNA methyltransferase [Candidatus Methylarchaceae archaeon HK02M2]|nr:RNA methyltransferase [Candidatus Methylarchaceae archaeon HK02M2]
MTITQQLWVALPDSLVTDSSHLREKTLKIGAVGRTCSIFGVSRIYLYKDSSGDYEYDCEVIKKVLEYMETPQYLRKQMFGKVKSLRYAGLLPPLRTPHHKLKIPLSKIHVGDLREGIVVKVGGKNMVDVGLSSLVPLEGKIIGGERVTVIFTSKFPKLECRLARKEEIKKYWGYVVKRVPSLGKLVKSANADLIIFTSRKGKAISEIWLDLLGKMKKSKTIMLAFGSPNRGLFEILSDENLNPVQLSKFTINMIPDQNTATIRTEEALLASLSLINLSIYYNL